MVPEPHQHAPISGGQYAFPDEAYRWLQNYALVTGFALVIGSGSKKKGRIEYLCVHHGKSRNTGHLSLEDRQRKTKSQAKDCKWMCFNSFKKIKGSGEAHKGWVLTVKELKHEHNLEPNAAHIYPGHKRSNLSYLKQLADFDRSVQAIMSIYDFKPNQDTLLILKHFTIHAGYERQTATTRYRSLSNRCNPPSDDYNPAKPTIS